MIQGILNYFFNYEKEPLIIRRRKRIYDEEEKCDFVEFICDPKDLIEIIFNYSFLIKGISIFFNKKKIKKEYILNLNKSSKYWTAFINCSKIITVEHPTHNEYIKFWTEEWEKINLRISK